MKRIWLVYPYGPVYGDIGKECRYTQFGRELASAGYDVIWWTANFSHAEKTFRCDGWKSIAVTEGFTTRLVPTTPYKRNISLGRIRFERHFSKQLLAGFLSLPKPDMIIVASTGMFNAFEPCCSYALKNQIPIVYDIMDIPLIESYMNQHHKLLVPIAKTVMKIERNREKRFFQSINGICALGKNQLRYAKTRAYNRDIPSCLVYNGIDVIAMRKNMDDTSNCKQSLVKDKDWTWCVFSGALGPSYDIETICQCAKLCEQSGDKIKFVIAGSGPQAELVRQTSEQCANLEYLGYISMKALAYVYKLSDIGLCAFAGYSTVDMPDKFYDYCAGGMAVLNTLQGEVKEYIATFQLGDQYIAGDVDNLYEQVKALSNPARLQQCKANAFKIGMEFDIKQQVKKLTNMVNSILDK